MRRSVEMHRDGQAQDRLVQLKHPMQRGTQLESEFWARQVGDIAAQWTARRHEIAASVVRKMYDAVCLIDQHARRRHLLDRATVQRGLAECDRRADRTGELDYLLAHAHRPEQARQQAWLLANLRGRLIEPGAVVDGAEQPWRMIGSLGRTEQQVSSWV